LRTKTNRLHIVPLAVFAAGGAVRFKRCNAGDEIASATKRVRSRGLELN
jgi:hypothetical protein